MYEVIAYNGLNEVKFDEYYLDREYALAMFNTAIKCVDCHRAIFMSATTGELFAEWTSRNGGKLEIF